MAGEKVLIVEDELHALMGLAELDGDIVQKPPAMARRPWTR
jgi:hypothetical protein